MTDAVTLSRYKLNQWVECPRCFWLRVRQGIDLPKTLPFALNNAIDHLLKVEYDAHRQAGTLPQVFAGRVGDARLFPDAARLATWRSTRTGLRWTDPATGHTLFGAIDDALQFPDGRLAIVDYKSTGSDAPHIYDSYQLQMDVYTWLLQQVGFRTAPAAYFAFYVVVKDDGFNGRLPFRAEVVEVTPQPERVSDLWHQAVATAQSDRAPEPGEECDLCRWYGEAGEALSSLNKNRDGSDFR